MKLLKVNYTKLCKDLLHAKTKDGLPIILKCSNNQIKELTVLLPFLQEGNNFNLLNVSEKEGGYYTAEFLILEPDYLIDISSLAECFKPYGHHPLNYLLSQLRVKDNTSPILIGNTANFFIDEFINESKEQPVDYTSSLKRLFQTSPFEFTACEDLKDTRLESEFFTACQKHFQHIRSIVNQMFPKAGIDKEKTVLEPSFISNTLGLQGRLDLMLNDFSAFVELKSGKGVEDFRTGGQFIHSCINHYTQMILYLAVLEFNLDLQPDDVRSYLLYSKYPILSKEKHSREQLQTALSLRNTIVALEYDLQQANQMAHTSEILNDIRSEVLNTENLTGKFFDNYLRPSIDKFRIAYLLLNEQEKTYFLRSYTFITKELWLSKVGEREYEGVKRASNLWNASFEDKMTSGELLYDLQMKDNQAASEKHTVTLQIPEYDDLYLPNFRLGDAVVLYERNAETDTVNNRQVFKGSIESLESGLVQIRLRFRQRNRSVWKEGALYALEHDYMDSTYVGMYRALATFIEANQERRDLLLCKRLPEFEPIESQIQPESTDLSVIINKALAAKDCFLLLGPPGTGKTSLALKQMVEAGLRENKTNLLLLSYTNRAVDEICKALSSISDSLPFIRIGSELNCAPEFQECLLDRRLDKCKRRTDVESVINNCRIFVGTVASVWNKPEIFQLKQFDRAIIDEATQLLEPHLLGILSAKTASGDNAVRRFVLIGDHKQLAAVVLQTKEESRVEEPSLREIALTDLSNSLFERLYRKYNELGLTSAFDILSKQGRMHPAIASFPSEYFYEGRLGCVGLPHQIEEWAHTRLNFYSIEPSTQEFSNKTNLNEANQVVAICKKLYQESTDFNPQSLGIITPFRNQIALIRKQLQETKISAFSEIMVDTVERFQGSQRDTIIYSFCVKTEGQLESLPNWMEENGKPIDRKLNVVLTRAKKQLHIIGNEKLLKKNGIYKKLLEHIKQTE